MANARSLAADNDFRDPDFESVRVASMREFEVEFIEEGKAREIVSAHSHDGGSTAPFLSFIVIGPTGQSTIPRMFHTGVVRAVREVTTLVQQTECVRQTSSVREREEARTRELAPEKKIVPIKNRSRRVH